MIDTLKTEILTLANTLNSEKEKSVWDMEEVLYLDSVIRNKIMEMMNALSFVSGSNEGYTLYYESFTNDELTSIERSLIHNPLPNQRPLNAWEYGYISSSII